MPRGSFNSSNMTSGGGLYEGPAELRNARVGKTDFNGKAVGDGKATAILVDYDYMNAEDELTAGSLILAMGKGIEPSEDGEEVAEEGPFFVLTTSKGFNEGSNAGIFLKSLAKARGEELDDESGVADLNGIKAVLTRVTLPPFEEGGKPRKVYTVSEVLTELPWDKPSKAAGKKAASPKGK